jgi:lipoyl-dependent peroxiredoxin subunit D
MSSNALSLDALIDSLPVAAKDLKLNYSSLVRNNTELSEQQLWGTIVATTIATRSSALTAAVLQAASAHLSPQAFQAAKTIAAIMGMNNIWYRFHHLSSNPKYGEMPARLRMSGLRGHGVEEMDAELWALAVSAVNGCGKCVDSHEKVVREKGATEELIAAAIRVTSVMHAIGAVLDQAAAESTASIESTATAAI